MRSKLVMLSAGALGLGFVQFASAADMLTKAPALAPVAYPWSGFYLGLSAGIRSAWARNNTTTAGLPGAEGPTIDFPTLATDSVNTKAKWDGSLRARLGYLATPSILLYATGGVSWLDLEANATCTPGGWCVAIRNETFTQTRTGWTVGGGVEGFVWGSWLARAEYRYADYGTMTNTHSPARSISSPLA